MLKDVEWGEYPLNKLFKKIKTNKLKYKTNDLPSSIKGEFNLPALTAGIQNQGLNNYVPRDNATILKNKITISANGANTGATFYQNKEFTVLQDAYAIEWIYNDNKLSHNQNIFLVGSISKTIRGKYEWTNKAGWERIKCEKIKLPIINNEIDFNYMEKFVAELESQRVAELESQRVAELEAYLTSTGLKDYTLTKEEEDTINNYNKLEWNTFNLEDLFGKSTRGKRLKSADRIQGDLPFVTAGEENEGVSAFIGNKVQIFQENTTTIDMFGSAKYRNYKYGGDDHLAIVHTEKLSAYSAIFVTTAIHKASHNGQFDYGRNFYAKDADILDIQLPAKDNKPDYKTMEIIISAIHKLVIKDVVLYADKKIEATKIVVNKGIRGDLDE